MKLSALAIATTLFSASVLAAPLTLQTYNPQENGIFAVNSTLASGPHEAVLFDAQFSVKDGEKLVEMIQKSGKKLTRISILACSRWSKRSRKPKWWQPQKWLNTLTPPNRPNWRTGARR